MFHDSAIQQVFKKRRVTDHAGVQDSDIGIFFAQQDFELIGEARFLSHAITEYEGITQNGDPVVVSQILLPGIIGTQSIFICSNRHGNLIGETDKHVAVRLIEVVIIVRGDAFKFLQKLIRIQRAHCDLRCDQTDQ